MELVVTILYWILVIVSIYDLGIEIGILPAIFT